MIIATAGHVDHGKTTLIKALTGKNTDQLAEEQRRGLTIDLGFAWLHDEQAGSIGFVDVPGHARFIRTMLAGLAGVDAALLVVAADEGPMPQTREHLDLLDLLGIGSAIVVMSKVDRADCQQRADCHAAINDLRQHSGLAGAPIIEVDAVSGRGLSELLSAIRSLSHNTPAPDSHGLPRFLIDRRFTVAGAGCVATGTLINGSLGLSQQTPLQIALTEKTVRLRGIQIDGQAVQTIKSGQRAALNLSGDLDNKHPQRGDWLLAASANSGSQRLDVHIKVLPGHTLHRGTLQILTGAAAVSGRLVWLDESAGLAQLLLDRPVHAIAGDSVIVREPAANITLAGGRVIDPQGQQRGRSKPQSLARLKDLKTITSASDALDTELQHRTEISLPAFARRWNLTDEQLIALVKQEALTTLGEQCLRREQLSRAETIILQTVRLAHSEYPEQLGTHQQALLRTIDTGLSMDTGAAIINQLVTDARLRRHGPLLALPDHQAILPATEAALWPQIHSALARAGLRPPIVGELGDLLGLAREDMLNVMHRLQAWGYVLPVAPNRFYLPGQLDDLAAIAMMLCEENADGGFLAAEYRDRSGVGRNLTINILEYLDRAGVTYYRAERRFMRPAWLRAAQDR